MLRRLEKICEFFDVEKIGYDRWRIEDLKQTMAEKNITLPPLEAFGQGYQSMGPAVDEFERRLLGIPEKDAEGNPVEGDVETLRHDGNPVMTWCAGNAVTVSDPANNRKVDKQKSIGRIDGIVGAVMATGISTGAKTLAKSVYDEGVGI